MGMSVGKKGMNCEINMTPMIDVLLTLIIIFMIVLPSTHGEDVDIPQPGPKGPETPNIINKNVVLEIKFNGADRPALKINEQPVTWDELQAKLRSIYEFRTQKVLFVKADSALEWQDVAPAIDTAHIAGVQNVGLLTDRMQTQ